MFTVKKHYNPTTLFLLIAIIVACIFIVNPKSYSDWFTIFVYIVGSIILYLFLLECIELCTSTTQITQENVDGFTDNKNGDVPSEEVSSEEASVEVGNKELREAVKAATKLEVIQEENEELNNNNDTENETKQVRKLLPSDIMIKIKPVVLQSNIDKFTSINNEAVGSTMFKASSTK